MHLTEQFHCPHAHDAALTRLTTLVAEHAERLLAEEYWADEHLDALTTHAGQSYTYVRDDSYNAFTDDHPYLYNRFKRCVYARVTQVLDAHSDEYAAFQFVTDTIDERKIKRIGWQQIRTALFDEDTPYVNWAAIETVVEKLNQYYDVHGRFPPAYTDLVNTPEPNGTLSYAPDKGDYHIHDVSVDGDDLIVTLNLPDSLTPESFHDWSDHEFRFPTHRRFHELCETGSLGAPTLHRGDEGFVIDIPVDVPDATAETDENRVLAVDLGVKKQATCAALERGDDTHEQVAPPVFVDHHAKQKLFRVKSDAEGINDRLQNLRRDGKAHTDRFDHLLSEYRHTRQRERNLRHQIQHDVANQLVWIALTHDCHAIVFESLGVLENPSSGRTAWSISSWARGDLLDLIEYKTALVGLAFDTVNPWGTSRHCPRCGKRGETVKAPNDLSELRHGGHFHCPHCEYGCDRDVVGAVNVGRKWLDARRMEEAKPVAYMAAGEHASFPSRARCEPRARSTGVQSAPVTGSVSGCQTLQSPHGVTLSDGRDEAESGGLLINQSSERAQPWAAGSVVESVLTTTTEYSGLPPFTTEN